MRGPLKLCSMPEGYRIMKKLSSALVRLCGPSLPAGVWSTSFLYDFRIYATRSALCLSLAGLYAMRSAFHLTQTPTRTFSLEGPEGVTFYLFIITPPDPPLTSGEGSPLSSPQRKEIPPLSLRGGEGELHRHRHFLHLASMLNLAVDVFVPVVIFTAMIHGPAMIRFIVALYFLPFSFASIV